MSATTRIPSDEAVRHYYAQKAEEEWQRLAGRRMEYAVTLRALADYLPPPPARILDCGGGPGRYAIELGRRGYEITLFDLSPECLDLAQEKAAEAQVELQTVLQGSATDLSALEELPNAGSQFDAVLLFGPLYHLIEEKARRRALQEVWRILRPGGLLFAAFITRYAVIRYKAIHDPMWILESARLQQLLTTGVLDQRDPDRLEFVAHYTRHPDVAPLCTSEGFEMMSLLGTEGLVHLIEDGLGELPSEAWEAWVDLNYRLASDPSILSCVGHLLAVARKGAC